MLMRPVNLVLVALAYAVLTGPRADGKALEMPAAASSNSSDINDPAARASNSESSTAPNTSGTMSTTQGTMPTTQPTTPSTPVSTPSTPRTTPSPRASTLVANPGNSKSNGTESGKGSSCRPSAGLFPVIALSSGLYGIQYVLLPAIM